jgi:hypothetical protein
MHEVDFSPPIGSVEHQCESFSAGDWIIFKCSRCQNYYRSINTRTGEMKVSGSNDLISHSGAYYHLANTDNIPEDSSNLADSE